jgi:hypothetical protein
VHGYEGAGVAAAKRRIEMSKSSSRFASAPNCQERKVSRGIRDTVQRLKYSRIISSREANKMGRFQYPGDSKRPSKWVSSLIISRISRRDFVGIVGVVVRLKALYFCFASTYL